MNLVIDIVCIVIAGIGGFLCDGTEYGTGMAKKGFSALAVLTAIRAATEIFRMTKH